MSEFESIVKNTTYTVCPQLINTFALSSLQPQTLQLDFLMKILPNYHHLKKTVKAGHSAS